jgi:hypothetical protein
MRKVTALLLFGLVLASLGFAATAIGSHGSWLRLLTGTSGTSTMMTSTNPGQREVEVCEMEGFGHRFGVLRRFRHFRHVTVLVRQSSVRMHLRHGDILGACPSDDDDTTPMTTTVTTTTTTPTTTTTTTTPSDDDDFEFEHGDDDMATPASTSDGDADDPVTTSDGDADDQGDFGNSSIQSLLQQLLQGSSQNQSQDGDSQGWQGHSDGQGSQGHGGD